LHHHPNIVKEEVPPLPLHYNPNIVKEEAPPLVFHYSPSTMKEEAPPLGVRPPLVTNLLAPLAVKLGEPYYGEERCQVEEKIPPSWQLTGIGKKTIATGNDKTSKGEEASHFSSHLVEEYLELFLQIRQ
jgi:hypothetical protein